MKFKGAWASGTLYDVGDVVTYEDGFVYHKQKACAAGIKPIDTLFWGKLNQVSAEVVNMISDLFSDLQTAVAAVQTNETKISAMIAPEYTKTTYSKDALRTHSGKLYKAKQNIGTAENWTASHWEETTVFAELSSILTSIGTINTSLTAVEGVVFDDKTLVLASSTASSTKKWAVTVDDTEGLEVNEIVSEGGDT